MTYSSAHKLITSYSMGDHSKLAVIFKLCVCALLTLKTICNVDANVVKNKMNRISAQHVEKSKRLKLRNHTCNQGKFPGQIYTCTCYGLIA